jgi:MFS family permease
MLGCLFFLFCAANAITTFFSLFAQEILHMITSEATAIMLLFAVAAAVGALPAGKAGKKFGRKKTILAGLAVFLVAFILFFGVFVGMLGSKNVTINDYVQVNNAYIAIDDQINAYNAERKTEAKEQGIEYDKNSELSMVGYVEYVEAKAAGKTTEADKYYAEFEGYLEANAGKDIYDVIVKVADNVFESDAEATFASAISDIQRTVDDVTKILRVLIFPVLILAGAANMFVTVNTLPLVLDIGGVEKVGTFTGYYYTATFSAQIASPIIYGVVRMLSGSYLSLFVYSPIMFILSILCIIFVKHGEAIPQEIVDKIEEENAD